MKVIQPHYETVDELFRNEIIAYIQKRKYLGLHYYTDIREYISTTGIIKEISVRPNGEFIILSTGEEIRLDRIVRLNGERAPGYHESDFTCDC